MASIQPVFESRVIHGPGVVFCRRAGNVLETVCKWIVKAMSKEPQTIVIGRSAWQW